MVCRMRCRRVGRLRSVLLSVLRQRRTVLRHRRTVLLAWRLRFLQQKHSVNTEHSSSSTRQSAINTVLKLAHCLELFIVLRVRRDVMC